MNYSKPNLKFVILFIVIIIVIVFLIDLNSRENETINIENTSLNGQNSYQEELKKVEHKIPESGEIKF